MSAALPRRRSGADRSAVLPSPVVMLSIVAVFMAAVAFMATRNSAPTEREVIPAAQSQASAQPSEQPGAKTEPAKPTKPPKPVVKRSEVYVEVYNNSGVSGLAGRVAERAGGAGWQVVGSDNWVGTIPASTVYYPPRLKPAGELLALDLGIKRKMTAVDPMRRDRLTVILTGELN